MYLLSIDLESWVQRPIYGLQYNSESQRLDDGYTENVVHEILNILKKYNARATFFTVGRIIKWYPNLLNIIKNYGHEIAYHGYSHKMLHKMDEKEFILELENGMKLAESFNISYKGFRSSSFSKIKNMQIILKQYKYKYDSSIIPIKTPLYNGEYIKNSKPFFWSNGLLEIPISVVKIAGIKFPIGGFYFRMFWQKYSEYLIKMSQKKYGITMIYLHPWEFKNYTGIKLPIQKEIFSKYGIPMKNKMEKILQKFKWERIDNNLNIISKMVRN